MGQTTSRAPPEVPRRRRLLRILPWRSSPSPLLRPLLPATPSPPPSYSGPPPFAFPEYSRPELLLLLRPPRPPTPDPRAAHTAMHHEVTTFERQTEMLSRLLEIASLTTVLLLTGTSLDARTMELGARIDHTAGEDDTFGEFLHLLRSGGLAQALRVTSDHSRQMLFFRAFRFDHHQWNNSDDRVPVVVVGVRLVGLHELAAHSDQESGTLRLTNEGSSPQETASPAEVASSYSSIDMYLDGFEREVEVAEEEEEEEELPEQWVIYVIGNTYTSEHPIMHAPLLMTENPTYEDLLTLLALLGEHAKDVVKPDDVGRAGDRLPIVVVPGSCVHRVGGVFVVPEGEGCQVCMEDLRDGDEVRVLHQCSHHFHQECIDEWITGGRNSCPLCRTRVVTSRA